MAVVPDGLGVINERPCVYVCVRARVCLWAGAVCCDHHFGAFLGEVTNGTISQECCSEGHLINQCERLPVPAELSCGPTAK